MASGCSPGSVSRTVRALRCHFRWWAQNRLCCQIGAEVIAVFTVFNLLNRSHSCTDLIFKSPFSHMPRAHGRLRTSSLCAPDAAPLYTLPLGSRCLQEALPVFLCGAGSSRSSDWASRTQFCQLAAHGHHHPGTAGPDLDARWACALPAGRSCACLSSVSVTEAKAGPLAVCLFVGRPQRGLNK